MRKVGTFFGLKFKEMGHYIRFFAESETGFILGILFVVYVCKESEAMRNNDAMTQEKQDSLTNEKDKL